MTKILPVIMCGGAGTRVWPESRDTLPKQFIPLVGESSTFQSTMRMLADPAFERPIVISNVDYRFMVADQLREIGAQADIVLKPSRRNSGPAVAVAAGLAARRRRRRSSLFWPPTMWCRISRGWWIFARRRPWRPKRALS